MKKVVEKILNQPIFYATLCILVLIIGATQVQYWFGEYSRSGLKDIKKNIAVIEQETDLIKEENSNLIQEKRKLSSGKEAIEGVARTELGMIKPGEKFYVFKTEEQDPN